MAKKHAMRVRVGKLKDGVEPVACQMCGIKKHPGRYLVTIQLPFDAVLAEKELRLGLQCASNFLHISRNGIEAWATPKPKWIEIG
jgi:hypothetical protein